MRRELSRGLGVTLAVALVIAVAATAVFAQTSEGLLPFPTSSATITLTDSGLEISPAQLDPGPVIFTIHNNSSETRGVYVTGQDVSGSDLLRYSMRIAPGGTAEMSFWLYQGRSYEFRDYTERSIIDGRSDFTSTFSTDVTIATVIPLGRGPSFVWHSGTINISDTGLDVSPQIANHGPIIFTINNNSSVARGIVITGPDRAGSDLLRYSKVVAPGDSARMAFWLYGGQSYMVRDYTSRTIIGDDMRFSSRFSRSISVTAATLEEVR